MKKLLFLFTLCTILSCNEDDLLQVDNDGVIIGLPYIWKTTLHKSGQFWSNSFIKPTIQYKGNVVVPTTNGDGNRFLTMLDANNGEVLWNWDDRYNKPTEYMDISLCYQYQNLLTYQVGGRSYCINLENGTTYWKHRRENSFRGRITGFDNNYFLFGPSKTKYLEYDEDVGYKGDITTGEIEEYIVPEFSLEYILGNRIGDVTQILPFKLNGTQHLAITWQEIRDTIWSFQTYLGLYNYETDQWIYKKETMNEPVQNGVVLAPPVIYKERIYANIGHYLVCHDLATGKKLWNRKFPQDFMFSGFIIAEDKIIANNEDTFTYCLNPDNGAVIWKTESAGTSGRISYLNGIVYFAGGSTSKLHAIEVATGKHVWKLDGKKLDDSGFRPEGIHVFPAKNGNPAKIIANTHNNAYCFEAYK